MQLNSIYSKINLIQSSLTKLITLRIAFTKMRKCVWSTLIPAVFDLCKSRYRYQNQQYQIYIKNYLIGRGFRFTQFEQNFSITRASLSQNLLQSLEIEVIVCLKLFKQVEQFNRNLVNSLYISRVELRQFKRDVPFHKFISPFLCPNFTSIYTFDGGLCYSEHCYQQTFLNEH